MPKRQPSLGREPGQKLRNYEQSVKRARLFCTKFHELIRRFHPPVSICSHILPNIPMLYSRELFEFASPIHCRASHRSSSKRLPMQHSACPTFMRETHYVASKFPLFRNAVFCPCFHVTRINHFSHALIPIMKNFVPRISPANPAWSSNQRTEHTSKVDVKFDHISTMDATGPSSKTSDWCHDGIEKFQLVSDGHISAQKNPFVGKESPTCRLQMVINIQSCILGTGCGQHATRPFVTRFLVLHLDNGSCRSSQKRWWLGLCCDQNGFIRIQFQACIT